MNPEAQRGLQLLLALHGLAAGDHVNVRIDHAVRELEIHGTHSLRRHLLHYAMLRCAPFGGEVWPRLALPGPDLLQNPERLALFQPGALRVLMATDALRPLRLYLETLHQEGREQGAEITTFYAVHGGNLALGMPEMQSVQTLRWLYGVEQTTTPLNVEYHPNGLTVSNEHGMLRRPALEALLSMPEFIINGYFSVGRVTAPITPYARGASNHIKTLQRALASELIAHAGNPRFTALRQNLTQLCQHHSTTNLTLTL